jgi:hypothetical protein
VRADDLEVSRLQRSNLHTLEGIDSSPPSESNRSSHPDRALILVSNAVPHGKAFVYCHARDNLDEWGVSAGLLVRGPMAWTLMCRRLRVNEISTPGDQRDRRSSDHARSWCQGLCPELALRITARMYIGALEGASGYAALRRAAPPHGPSPWLGSGPRHIRAIRYQQLRE